MVDGGIFEKRLRAYKKQAESARNKTLVVGFFEGSTYPDGTLVAEVAYWNEFGVPSNKQPRPFFRQAIEVNKGNWVSKIRELAQNGATIDQIMSIIGQDIVIDIQSSIRDFTDPPLKASTIAIKRRKKSKHPDKPLMDEEIMYKAVQWVINNGD